MAEISALFDLTGKVAIMTGAGSGLGQVFARALADAGATVIAADRIEARAHETVELIVRDGGKAEVCLVDVAEAASVQAMADRAAKDFGRIDVLVNNAGVTTTAARLHELAIEDDWTRLIQINLTGAFLATRAVVPLMLGRGGSIINISSILGLGGHYPGFAAVNAAYAAAKAGLIGLTRQTALEYAKDNIRCNAIAPGWTGGTRLSEGSRRPRTNGSDAQFEDASVSGPPLWSRGQPDEMKGLILYLASEASSYVTGQVIAHDGGWTAR